LQLFATNARATGTDCALSLDYGRLERCLAPSYSIRFRFVDPVSEKWGGQARYAASLADITAGHEDPVKLVMGEANRYCAARRSRSFAAITPATQQE